MTEKIIKKTIEKYYNKHYGKYDKEIEFYTDPSPYSWFFEVPSLKICVILRADPDSREIEEERFLAKGFHPDDEFVVELWKNLENVSFDPETLQLEQDYFIWNAKTNKEDIWHWFDEHYSQGLCTLLYELEN